MALNRLLGDVSRRLTLRWAMVAGVLLIGLVAVFYGGAVAFVSSLPRSSPAAQNEPAPALASASAATPEPMRFALSDVVLSSPAAAPAFAPARPASAPPPAAARQPSFHRLGKVVRAELMSGLANVGARLASCPDDKPAGGGENVRAARAAAAPPTLLLEIATVRGGIEIADVKSDLQGVVTEAFLECARRELRGKVVPAQTATAGTRMLMPYRLASR